MNDIAPKYEIILELFSCDVVYLENWGLCFLAPKKLQKKLQNPKSEQYTGKKVDDTYYLVVEMSK